MSGEELLLGIDIGTLGSKGVLINSEGEVLWRHFVEHGIDIIRPGWVEQDPETCYWGDFKQLVGHLIKTSNLNPRQIGGIGISSLAPDVILVDERGESIRPCILYMDRRAEEECEWVRKEIGEKKVFEVTGNTIDSYFAGNEILWCMRNELENYRKTWKILNANGYLVLKLTGEASIDSSTGCIFSPLFDYKKKNWSQELCQETGVDMEKLPDVYDPPEKVGEVTLDAERETGLASGTPVIAGGSDAMMSALAVGVLDGGESALTYGTTSCWVVVQDKPNFDPKMVNALHTRPGKYISAGAMVTTGAIVRWFRDQFSRMEKHVGNSSNIDPYHLLDLEAEKISPGSNGLITLPYFMGERTPIWNPKAKGMIFGLSLGHTRPHIYRSILEGVAYGVRQHMEIAKSKGIRIKNIKAVGGGAKSRIWKQIISDVTGHPQFYVPDAPGAPLGDAFLAGICVGIFENFDEIRSFLPHGEEIKPNEKLYEEYSKLYQIYLNLYENTVKESTLVHRLQGKAF